jgi:hypothetical protein
MSNSTYYVVEGWRPFNRFHRPLESVPASRFSLIEGPDDAFYLEHLADRTLVKVVDPSLVTVTRFESEQDLINRRGQA